MNEAETRSAALMRAHAEHHAEHRAEHCAERQEKSKPVVRGRGKPQKGLQGPATWRCDPLWPAHRQEKRVIPRQSNQTDQAPTIAA
jgi:hypothetical protein